MRHERELTALYFKIWLFRLINNSAKNWKVMKKRKSRIRETLNLLTNAASSTNTKTDRNQQIRPEEFFLFFVMGSQKNVFGNF